MNLDPANDPSGYEPAVDVQVPLPSFTPPPPSGATNYPEPNWLSAVWLTPDADACRGYLWQDLVSLEVVQQELGLGPNGAQMYAIEVRPCRALIPLSSHRCPRMDDRMITQ